MLSFRWWTNRSSVLPQSHCWLTSSKTGRKSKMRAEKRKRVSDKWRIAGKRDGMRSHHPWSIQWIRRWSSTSSQSAVSLLPAGWAPALSPYRCTWSAARSGRHCPRYSLASMVSREWSSLDPGKGGYYRTGIPVQNNTIYYIIVFN